MNLVGNLIYEDKVELFCGGNQNWGWRGAFSAFSALRPSSHPCQRTSSGGPKEHRSTTAGLGEGGGESSKWLLFLSKVSPMISGVTRKVGWRAAHQVCPGPQPGTGRPLLCSVCSHSGQRDRGHTGTQWEGILAARSLS